jgi:hypothetical protein
MRKFAVLLSMLSFYLLPALPAYAGFWTDWRLRVEAEDGKLEVADACYVDPDGVFTVEAWWFNGSRGVISRLVVFEEVFFLRRYYVCTSVHQPWLHEFIPGFDHAFIASEETGVVNVEKNYDWYDSETLWKHRVDRYYEHWGGKSFFRLRRGSAWIFWVIDPLAEEETTL